MYYELLEDGTIGKSTNSLSIAKELNLTLYTEKEIVFGFDGKRYFKGEEPLKPEPTKEEQQQARQEAYKAEVDPITCHIQRLGDEEQTAEVITEIANLVAERKAKVAEIKARYPYPVEPVVETEEVTSVMEKVDTID